MDTMSILSQPSPTLRQAKYLILWNFGGIYVDLDIEIIAGKSIESLFCEDYFL